MTGEDAMTGRWLKRRKERGEFRVKVHGVAGEDKQYFFLELGFWIYLSVSDTMLKQYQRLRERDEF